MKNNIILYFLLILLMIISACSEEDNLLTITDNASLEGSVNFEDSSPDLISADISLWQNDDLIVQTTNDSTGYFRFDNLTEGNYVITFYAEGYTESVIDVTLLNNVIWTIDNISLLRMASSLDGYVSFENASTNIISALVSVARNNQIYAETYTDSNGYYLLEGLMYNENRVTISKNSYITNSFLIDLTNYIVTTAEPILMIYAPPITQKSIVIDGEIDEGWQPVYIDDHVSGWGPNDFGELYLAYDEDSLYIAVTGSFSNSDNTVSICIDTDNSPDTGLNDFNLVEGGEIGNRIRKNITAPESFGADFAINSGWGLSNGEGVVSLVDTIGVDDAQLENVQISMNSSTLEFAISFNDIYGENVIPTGISLIAYIGGGGDDYFANDVIPQGNEDFDGTFLNVFKIEYDNRR